MSPEEFETKFSEEQRGPNDPVESMKSMVRRLTFIYKVRMWLLAFLLVGVTLATWAAFALAFPLVTLGFVAAALVLLFRWENLL